MCGIAGIVSRSNSLSPNALCDIAKAMADSMPYRGPDDSGVWLAPDQGCALSHRRLSIIDTSAGGHQPMVSDDGQLGIAFNGEIYNFLEIRPELESKGDRFKTKSDTEVLLAALHRWDVEVLPKLDAMFAVAYYDANKRELLLARDVFGEKPLYYIETEHYFCLCLRAARFDRTAWIRRSRRP